MAWSELDSAANAGASASGSSISVSRTYTGGERAVVWVTVGGATTITVTDGTNTYTQVGSQVVANSGDVQAVFECLSCTAGTFTVQANFGTSNAFRGIAVHRFSGLTGSGSLVGAAQTAPGTGADGLSSGNLTPASQPALLLGISTDYNGFTINVGTGFTSSAVYTNVDTANGSYTVSETKRLTSTAAVPATATATTSPSNFVTLAYWAAEPVNPAITGVSTMTPRQGESFTITGTNFGATQGSGYVVLGPVSNRATQYTTLSWSDTSITIIVDRDTNPYGAGVDVAVIDNSLNSSGYYALTSLLPQTGWDYVNIGTPNTTASFRITSTADLASGDQVAYDTLGSTVTVFSDGTFSVSGSPYYFNAEVWTSPDGWGQTTPQVLIAGPRSRSMLGNPIGAGPAGTFLLGSVGLGSVVTQAGVSGGSSQAAGGVVLIVAGSSRNRGEVDAKVAIGARGSAQSQGPAAAAVAQIISFAGVASSLQQAEGRVGLAVVGAAQSTAPAVGGTVVAAVAAGAAGSSSQAAGQVVLAIFGNAQSISQIVAPVSVLATGQTHGLGPAAASQTLAAQGAAGAASQAAGVSSSAAVGATSGEGASASQAAGQVAIAVVGVSSGGGAAAGAQAQIVAVGGESFVVSGGVSNVAVAARGEGHGLAPATAAFVSSAVIAGVAQSLSTAQGIGVDGNAPVPDGDTYCGFIVNVGRLMHR